MTQLFTGLILVLGSPNRKDGSLHSVAMERCRRTVALSESYPDYGILCTGGFGVHFNQAQMPHAHYVKQFLILQGIAESRFTEFALSRNTREDATLSRPIVLDAGASHIIVVTSDYHEDRARFIFAEEYRKESLNIDFELTETNEKISELDIAALRMHEKNALKKLRMGG